MGISQQLRIDCFSGAGHSPVTSGCERRHLRSWSVPAIKSGMDDSVPTTPDRRHARYDPRFEACNPVVPTLWWIAGMSVLSFVVVAGVTLLIQLLVYHANALGTVLVSGSVAGLLVFHITNGIRNRRKAAVRRLRAISELNHHVRNALQQIVAVTSIHTSGGYQEIASAVDRIERILRDSTTEIRSEEI